MSHPERLLGTHIEGHHVTKILGSGAFADVYEVWTPAGEKRALKLLREGLDPRARAADRLGQEAVAIAAIVHVNVVGYHGGGLFEGRLWILVDYVDGEDLRKRARAAGGRLPVEEVLGIIRQACEGVAAAHRKGILHRDLKPENILVTSQGVAKVADFGSAKLAEWGMQTAAEEQVCSARHRAPETLHPHGHLPESDVFSMGVILYELLSGTHPFCPEPLSVMGVTQRLLAYAPPPPLCTLGRGIPEDVSDLVQRALSPEPEDRGSMEDLIDALEAAQQRLRAPLRGDARSLPVPGRESWMAKTERQMPQIPQLGGGGEVIEPIPAAPPERRTTLPMAPVGPVTAPSEMRRAPAATVPMSVAELGALDDRRSTGIPVEKAGLRPSSAVATTVSRRRLSLVVTAGALVVGAGMASVGWFWAGEAPRPAPGAPLVPPRASASATPPAPGSASTVPFRVGPPGARGPGKRTRH